MKPEQTLLPFLWFNEDAEEAVAFYISVFGGREQGRFHFPESGKVGTIDFEIEGMRLTALNGGKAGEYTDAMSLMVIFDDQARLDRAWNAIRDGGGKEVACGWIRDRWGVRWQMVPRVMDDLLHSTDKAAQARGFAAMMQMVRLDGPAIEAAAYGKAA